MRTVLVQLGMFRKESGLYAEWRSRTLRCKAHNFSHIVSVELTYPRV